MEAETLEPSSPAEGPMKGAERRRFKAGLLAIAADAEERPEEVRPPEEEPPSLLSSAQRRRQKAGLKAAAAAAEALQQEPDETGELHMDAELAADTAIALGEPDETRPRKKRRRISISLPAAAAAVDSEAAADNSAPAQPGTDGSVGRKGSRRKHECAEQADAGGKMDHESRRGREETLLER